MKYDRKNIQRFFFVIIMFSLVVVALLAVFLYKNVNKLKEIENNRYKLYALGIELKESSEDLTKYCRSYVLTGDSIWEKKYWELLDIRNGLKPRPDGNTISLRDSLLKLGIADNELQKLALAEKNSNDLVWTERVAFHAMKGLFLDSSKQFTVKRAPDTAYARRIMFDEKYQFNKKSIMDPIAEFRVMLDQRIAELIERQRKKNNALLIFIFVVITIIIVLAFYVILILRRRIIDQLDELESSHQIIKTNEEKLIQLNKDLDVKVEERSKELKKRNFELEMAKENVERNEHELKKAQEITHIGSWYLNLATNKVTWTEELYKMYGFDPSKPAPPYTEHMALFTPESWEILSAALENTKQTGTPYGLELQTVRKDKSNGWMWVRGEAIQESEVTIALWGAAQDITDRKNMELALKKAKESAEENEERYRGLINHLEAGVVVHASDTSIIMNNSRAEELLGLSTEQMRGKVAIDPRWKFIYEDNNAVSLDNYPVMMVINSRESIRNHVMGVYRKPNDVVWLIVNGFPVFNSNKEISEVIISFIDITYQKQTELLLKERNRKIRIQNEEYRRLNEKLIRAKEKAEEGDRLKSAFLQNMSHEIRTPLNAICGFSGMLDKVQREKEKRKEFVSIIKNSSNQLLSIVTDILTISSIETKQEKFKTEKTCINSVLNELQAIFNQQSKKETVSLLVHKPLNDKQSTIWSDKTKITQILTNLISNALKFTHEGYVEFGYELNNDFLEFYVKDSGIGIHEKYHKIIFERFNQSERNIQQKYGGTGLGLAISKGFVELLNGEIWLESEQGKGSVFHFTIPYLTVYSDDNTENKPDVQIASENKPVILIAEDEDYNYLYIEEMLFELGYKLYHAKNGQEAIDIFIKNPNISLILMDIKMPGVDGYRAAKTIKEIKPNVPIIAQSAYLAEYEPIENKHVFNDYLNKPIEEELLIGAVKKHIDVDQMN